MPAVATSLGAGAAAMPTRGGARPRRCLQVRPRPASRGRPRLAAAPPRPHQPTGARAVAGNDRDVHRLLGRATRNRSRPFPLARTTRRLPVRPRPSARAAGRGAWDALEIICTGRSRTTTPAPCIGAWGLCACQSKRALSRAVGPARVRHALLRDRPRQSPRGQKHGRVAPHATLRLLHAYPRRGPRGNSKSMRPKMRIRARGRPRACGARVASPLRRWRRLAEPGFYLRRWLAVIAQGAHRHNACDLTLR